MKLHSLILIESAEKIFFFFFSITIRWSPKRTHSHTFSHVTVPVATIYISFDHKTPIWMLFLGVLMHYRVFLYAWQCMWGCGAWDNDRQVFSGFPDWQSYAIINSSLSLVFFFALHQEEIFKTAAMPRLSKQKVHMPKIKHKSRKESEYLQSDHFSRSF